MTKHVMKLFPFGDVVANARQKMKQGWIVHLQFNCSGCGAKQTFGEENYLSETGRCEECGVVTSLKKDGCNLMLISRR